MGEVLSCSNKGTTSSTADAIRVTIEKVCEGHYMKRPVFYTDKIEKVKRGVVEINIPVSLKSLKVTLTSAVSAGLQYWF